MYSYLVSAIKEIEFNLEFRRTIHKQVIHYRQLLEMCGRTAGGRL